MKGLLLKELLMVKQRLIVFVLFIIMFIGWSVMGMVAIAPMISVFLAMFLVGHINYDEQSKWQVYSIALPYGRKTIVSSKYATMAISALFSTLIAIGCYIFTTFKDETFFTAKMLVVYVAITIALGLLYPALILPLTYKFNSEKGRMVMIFINVAMGGLVGFAVTSSSSATTIFIKLSQYSSILPYIGVAAAILLFMFSWFISVKIYEKKEF